MVTCWEKADLVALLYVMFSLYLFTFSNRVLAQVWYLIVSIPGICLLPYFKHLFYIIVLLVIIFRNILLIILSHEVASGSDIHNVTLCNKIGKPLVVYRFSGNVMIFIITLRSGGKILTFSRQKCDF